MMVWAVLNGRLSVACKGDVGEDAIICGDWLIISIMAYAIVSFVIGQIGGSSFKLLSVFKPGMPGFL